MIRVLLIVFCAGTVAAQPHEDTIPVHDHGHNQNESAGAHENMSFDRHGMLMNQNTAQLPADCVELAGDHEITVHAGVNYTSNAGNGNSPGTFGYSEHEYEVLPCSRVTVTLVNEDEVRHQWMLHGLPRYLYPQGMFHLEAAGGQSRTGTFIVPGDNATYLVHCDIAQHMEKGMKAQLLVGKGSGDLSGIPGVSEHAARVEISSFQAAKFVVLPALIGFSGMWLGLSGGLRRRQR